MVLQNDLKIILYQEPYRSSVELQHEISIWILCSAETGHQLPSEMAVSVCVDNY